MQESLKRLEMFNPILGAMNMRNGSSTDEDRKEFFDKVASLSDDAHELNSGLQKLFDD